MPIYCLRLNYAPPPAKRNRVIYIMEMIYCSPPTQTFVDLPGDKADVRSNMEYIFVANNNRSNWLINTKHKE